MRHEQDGEVELVEKLLQLESQRRARVRVERRQRLVEEEHAGIASERSCESDPLALTARELAGPSPRQVSDPEALEEPARAVARPVRDVLLDRHVREQRVVLEDEPDAAMLGRERDAGRGVEQHLAVEHDPPALRPDESRDRAQHGRLPRPGRADQREGLTTEREGQLEPEGAKG